MAETLKYTTPDISGLSNGQIFFIGSVAARNFAFQFVGSGFTSEDSTWEMVESNDRVTWTGLNPAAAFTGENATNEAVSTSDMTFIGLRLLLKNTETTGTNTIHISAKD